MTTPLPSYKGHRYPVEIINHCVWLYFRFPLSFRDGEERCSNAVSRSATRRSGGGAPSSGRPTPTGCADARPRPGDKWNLDEVFIRINGTQHYLWRAVDQHGIEGLEYVPRVIVTDKLGSYRGAPRVAGLGRAPPVEVFEHRAENSHQPTRQRERAIKRFKSPGHAQRFLSAFSRISPHFRPRRHRLSAPLWRSEMADRFAVWREVTATDVAA